MIRARVEPAAVNPDDDREPIGAVVDAGVGVDLGGGGGRGVVRDEDVEVEAILARLGASEFRGRRTCFIYTVPMREEVKEIMLVSVTYDVRSGRGRGVTPKKGWNKGGCVNSILQINANCKCGSGEVMANLVHVRVHIKLSKI